MNEGVAVRAIFLRQDLLDDEAFRALPDDVQLAFFRVRLDYRLGVTGCGRVPWQDLLGRLCPHTGSEVAAGRLLAQLAAKPWVLYDRATGVVVIPGAFRIEPDTPGIRHQALKELRLLPWCEALSGWVERYRERWESEEARPWEKDEIRRFIETAQDPKAARSRHGSYAHARESARGRADAPSRVRASGRTAAGVPDRTGPDRKVRSEDGPYPGEREGAAVAPAPAGTDARPPEPRSPRTGGFAHVAEEREPEPPPNRPLSDDEQREAEQLAARLRRIGGS